MVPGALAVIIAVKTQWQFQIDIHSPTWPILLLVSTADMCLLSLPRVIIKFRWPKVTFQDGIDYSVWSLQVDQDAIRLEECWLYFSEDDEPDSPLFCVCWLCAHSQSWLRVTPPSCLPIYWPTAPLWPLNPAMCELAKPEVEYLDIVSNKGCLPLQKHSDIISAFPLPASWYPQLLQEIYQDCCRDSCFTDWSIESEGFSSLLDFGNEPGFLPRQVCSLWSSNPFAPKYFSQGLPLCGCLWFFSHRSGSSTRSCRLLSSSGFLL